MRGSVIDVRFESTLPPIKSLLRAGESGQVAIEVLSELDEFTVRGIALTPTQGLARGMLVVDTGGELQADRPPTASGQCRMAFGPSGTPVTRALLHQVRSLRDRH